MVGHSRVFCSNTVEAPIFHWADLPVVNKLSLFSWLKDQLFFLPPAKQLSKVVYVFAERRFTHVQLRDHSIVVGGVGQRVDRGGAAFVQRVHRG